MLFVHVDMITLYIMCIVCINLYICIYTPNVHIYTYIYIYIYTFANIYLISKCVPMNIRRQVYFHIRTYIHACIHTYNSYIHCIKLSCVTLH